MNTPGHSYDPILICPICKKQFLCYNQGMWVYKRQSGNRKLTFCSWTCARKHDKAVEEAPQKPDGRKNNHFRGRRIAG